MSRIADQQRAAGLVSVLLGLHAELHRHGSVDGARWRRSNPEFAAEIGEFCEAVRSNDDVGDERGFTGTARRVMDLFEDDASIQDEPAMRRPVLRVIQGGLADGPAAARIAG